VWSQGGVKGWLGRLGSAYCLTDALGAQALLHAQDGPEEGVQSALTSHSCKVGALQRPGRTKIAEEERRLAARERLIPAELCGSPGSGPFKAL